MTNKRHKRQADQSSHGDEPGVVYPVEVRRGGPRAEHLYDALMRELTTGADAVDVGVAEFMVQQQWRALTQALEEGRIDLDPPEVPHGELPPMPESRS